MSGSILAGGHNLNLYGTVLVRRDKVCMTAEGGAVDMRAARIYRPLGSTKLADRPPDVCNQYIPGVRRVSACMSAYRRYLSPACRAVFYGGQKKKMRRR
jgi:hypothetical protein